MAIIQLLWDAPSTENGGGEAESYIVYRNSVELMSSVVSTSASDEVSDGTYIYTVSAVNAAGEGPSSNGASVTVPA